jgi:hypothetical protein
MEKRAEVLRLGIGEVPFQLFHAYNTPPSPGKVSPHKGEAVGEDSARGLMDRLLNNSKECPEIHRHE